MLTKGFMPKVILGLGSNIGDRRANLQAAIDGIKAFASGMRFSSVLESAALLPDGAPADWDKTFYNMAVAAECDLAPMDLLLKLKSLEGAIGRDKRAHWAPREIDIDILAYAEEAHTHTDLVIPHPHLFMRDFALLPFAELWPDWRSPAAGRYQGWQAGDIAADLHYAYSDKLYPADVDVHG